MGLLSFGRRKDEAAAEDSPFAAAPAEQETASARPKARRKGRAADPIDPVLPEKQRARRRLIGAVALVLAAVIGLPMILDPEPKPLPADISIDIPAKDKAKPAAPATAPASASLDQREEIVTPDSAAPPVAAKPATPAPGAAAVAGAAGAAMAAKTDAAKPESKADGKAADPKAADPKADAKADTKALSKEPAEAKGKSDTKSDSKDAAHKSDKLEDSRARAILDGRDAQTEKHESYMVQVAALASADKVRELQNKLKAAGIKSTTQKVATQSGERIRVRVGPLQSRAEAEKMRARLNKLGLNGTLVPA